ncbi:PAS domain-containing protein [Pseudanabaena sp. BC1403]|uniref:PAS domain-containing protein n=1 Tax=Pseudanabaena sp. BC1403 TaxID=2043171 RepID=UPI000CD814A8|nr:PAS domain-containing protein [Pseudanabaena sp. BC1403]
MSTDVNVFTTNDLGAVIVRNPLVVKAETTVIEAISQMSDRNENVMLAKVQASCVLVVEEEKVLGIFTEHDVVRLIAQSRSLETLTMQEVMTSPVLTIQETECADLSSLMKMMQQQHIRHLPILNDDNRLLGIVTIESLLQEMHSSSQLLKKSSEAELKLSEQRFRSVTKAAPVGICRTDKLGNCIYMNDRWCQISGLTPSEAEGLGWINGIHPCDRELLSREWNDSMQENRPFKLEYRFQNLSGRITWAYAEAVAEYDELGEIIGYVGTITDISDRKATEQALKLQRDLNQLIAEITSRFIDISPEYLDAEINLSLQLIGEATNSDTSYLIKFLVKDQDDSPLPEGTVSMTHEWCKPKYPRQIEQVQNVPLSAFPWSNTKLLQREVVNIPRVIDAPREAIIDQASWQRFNIVSSLSVPLIQKSVVTGTLGFASFSDVIYWDEEIIRLLQVMAQTIANAQQRAQDEQQLYESEERLRLALRAANQGLYDLNLQTGEVIVSLEYATMLGHNPATFQETNAKWIERLHPDDREHVTKVYQEYVAGLSPEYKVEFRQLTQTGEWKWILSLGRIVAWDESGNPLRMLGTHTDISDRKKAEAERLLAKQVRQELKFLENILDIVLAGYWDWDLQTNEEYLSKGLKQMFGYEDDELPNSPETWQHLIFDEDLPMVFECFDQHVQSHGEVPFYNEVRYRHKDGSTVWVNCSGKVIEWDQEGKPLRMIGCHIDITKQKQAENSLRKSDIHLKTAQRIGRLGSWEFILDPEQVIWSDELFHIFGRDRTMAPPNFDELQELLHPDDRDHHQQTVQTAIVTGKPFDIEFRFFHQDGNIRYIQARGEPILDDSNCVIQLIGTALDISDRKQAEATLIHTTTQLVSSNRELEAFAYSVSHDLRSPLRAIDGFSQALIEDYGDKFDNEGKDYFDRIRRNIKRMGMLIDDLLRLSRVSRSEMRYSKINLSMLIAEQLNELQTAEPERQVKFVIAPDVFVSADSTLMQMVISNLVQNAWKFTSNHATARIEFGLIPSESNQNTQFTYFVRDDGAGFDMNYADMLFGVFQRLHNTNEFAGTGIGLATVQRVIHRHGGRVWAEGAIEHGATIYFTIPDTMPSSVTNVPIGRGA